MTPDPKKCGCGGAYIEINIHERPILQCDKCNSKYMKCVCGSWMPRGSGYFPTDYKCTICDKEYNSSGLCLAPREQWGEETGEQF